MRQYIIRTTCTGTVSETWRLYLPNEAEPLDLEDAEAVYEAFTDDNAVLEHLVDELSDEEDRTITSAELEEPDH